MKSLAVFSQQLQLILQDGFSRSHMNFAVRGLVSL